MKQGFECTWSEKLSKLDRWKEAKAYMRMCIIILTLGDRTDSAKDSWEVHRMSPELSAWRQCNYPPSTRAAPRGVDSTSLLGSWVSRCPWCGDCCSVTQSCLTLWPHGLQHARLPCPSLSPGVCSNGDSLLHWVNDAIQQSYPLSLPSPPAFNLSQHQDLFQWVSSLHQVAKVLELQLQRQSFQWIFRVDVL